VISGSGGSSPRRTRFDHPDPHRRPHRQGELRLVALDVDPQDVITATTCRSRSTRCFTSRRRPGEGDRAGGELRLRHVQLAQTTLRSVCARPSLTTCCRTRQNQCQAPGDPGHPHRPLGIKSPPSNLNKSICPGDAAGDCPAAEAERERRAKVINAEGEFQAAAKLAEAPLSSKNIQWHYSCAICRPCVRCGGEQLHHLSAHPIELSSPFSRTEGEGGARKRIGGHTPCLLTSQKEIV